MDYKKKYNDALERARKLKEDPQGVFYEYSPKEGDTICDYIFPELAESEDERIMKGIESEYYLRAKQGLIDDIPLEGSVNTVTTDSKQEKRPIKVPKIKEETGVLKQLIDEEKFAWSEEDERNLQGIIDEIEANKKNAPDYDFATYDRFLSWLKSIKQRYTWKPSDNQMASITCAVRKMKESACYDSELVSLLNDLKKLKGE